MTDNHQICRFSNCNAAATASCGYCFKVFYCGKDHQKEDWNRHKIEQCLPYALRTNSKFRLGLIAQRGYRGVIAKPAISCGSSIYKSSVDDVVVGPEFKVDPIDFVRSKVVAWFDLTKQLLETRPVWISNLSCCREYLSDYSLIETALKPRYETFSEEFKKIHSFSQTLSSFYIVKANAFELYLGPPGRYMLKFSLIESMFNHSCIPNAVPESSSGVIFAVRDIKAGEEITISYTKHISFHQPVKERIFRLNQKFGFDCNCEYCNGVDTSFDDKLNETKSFLREERDSLTKLFKLAKVKYENDGINPPISYAELNKQQGMAERFHHQINFKTVWCWIQNVISFTRVSNLPCYNWQVLNVNLWCLDVLEAFISYQKNSPNWIETESNQRLKTRLYYVHILLKLAEAYDYLLPKYEPEKNNIRCKLETAIEELSLVNLGLDQLSSLIYVHAPQMDQCVAFWQRVSG